MPLQPKATFPRRQQERLIRAVLIVAAALLLAGSFTGIVPRHDAELEGPHVESRR